MSVLLSALKSVVSHPSLEKRSRFSQVAPFHKVADQTRTISHLLPMFLQMLKDEFPDVRLHIISKLELVNDGK